MQMSLVCSFVSTIAGYVATNFVIEITNKKWEKSMWNKDHSIFSQIEEAVSYITNSMGAPKLYQCIMILIYAILYLSFFCLSLIYQFKIDSVTVTVNALSVTV